MFRTPDSQILRALLGAAFLAVTAAPVAARPVGHHGNTVPVRASVAGAGLGPVAGASYGAAGGAADPFPGRGRIEPLRDRILAEILSRIAVHITSIAPAAAAVGDSVTLTGSGFGGPWAEVRVGGVRARIICASLRRLTFRVPAGVAPGQTTVTVANPGGRRDSISLTVTSHAKLTVDEAHAVSATIGADGGVITASSQGRTYRLTIPAGALADDEVIVMTPITAIGDVPLKRLLGGVHFAPEGLHFYRAASLEIDLPAGTSLTGLIGFSAAGNGDDFHLVPVNLGTSLSLPIAHFSAAGFGGGALSIGGCQTPSLECTYTTLLAATFAAVSQQVCGTDCATPDALAAHIFAIGDAFAPIELSLLQEWFSKVAVLFDGSRLDTDANLTHAAQEFENWAAWVNGYPCGAIDCSNVSGLAADITEGKELLGVGFVLAFQRSLAACTDGRTRGLIADVDGLALLGRGGLADTDAGLRDAYACQMVLALPLPVKVAFGQTVPIAASVALRTGGAAGPVNPLANLPVNLSITDGCGTLGTGSSRTVFQPSDAAGSVATGLTAGLPCVGTQNRIEIVVAAGDLLTETGDLIAFGRRITVSTSISSKITVTPPDQTVFTGGQVSYEAAADLPGAQFFWSTNGGTITQGPSATAVFTAGGVPGDVHGHRCQRRRLLSIAIGERDRDCRWRRARDRTIGGFQRPGHHPQSELRLLVDGA